MLTIRDIKQSRKYIWPYATGWDLRNFVSHIKVVDNGVWKCWEWTGCKNSQGYGCAAYSATEATNSISIGAHRLSMLWSRGWQWAHLHTDHLCRNRACVNPQHLEPVTPAVNNSRKPQYDPQWLRAEYAKRLLASKVTLAAKDY